MCRPATHRHAAGSAGIKPRVVGLTDEEDGYLQGSGGHKEEAIGLKLPPEICGCL